MPECSDAERKWLDRLHECDVIFGLRDEDMTTIAWMRGFSARPAATFTVDYGHIDGKRLVRRLKLTLGMTAKEFDAAVERGRESALA